MNDFVEKSFKMKFELWISGVVIHNAMILECLSG